MQLSMPATATPASASCSSVGTGGLELADEPGDLAGGDAGADGEPADLVDDDGRAAVAVGAGRFHGGRRARAGWSARRARRSRRRGVRGGCDSGVKRGTAPYRTAPSSRGAVKVKKRSSCARAAPGRRARAPTRAPPPGRPRGRCAGAKPSSARARVGVRAGVAHVAGLARRRGARRAGGPASAGERLERAVEAHAVAAADVVDAARRRVGVSPAARVAATMSAT